MSDDGRIIDFNEAKNKVKESDVDKFEGYMYDLYYDVSEGKMKMSEFSQKLSAYMRENSISPEKMFKIQKKFMERYGMDMSNVEEELKGFGIDINNLKVDPEKQTPEEMERIKRSDSFYSRYGNMIKSRNIVVYNLKNNLNDVEITIDSKVIKIYSEKKIDLNDPALNEFLAGYRRMFNEQIKVVMCEATKTYDY